MRAMRLPMGVLSENDIASRCSCRNMSALMSYSTSRATLDINTR